MPDVEIPSAESVRAISLNYIQREQDEKYEYIKGSIESAARNGKRYVIVGRGIDGRGYEVSDCIGKLRNAGYTVTENNDFFFDGYKIEW